MPQINTVRNPPIANYTINDHSAVFAFRMLFRLPRELRDQVYHWTLLDTSKACQARFTLWSHRNSISTRYVCSSRNTGANLVALSWTCRGLNEEVSALVPKLCTLCVHAGEQPDESLRHRLVMISPEGGRGLDMQKVCFWRELCLDFEDPKSISEDLTLLRQSLPKLRDICLLLDVRWLHDGSIRPKSRKGKETAEMLREAFEILGGLSSVRLFLRMVGDHGRDSVRITKPLQSETPENFRLFGYRLPPKENEYRNREWFLSGRDLPA